jgi:hypothetical protein
VALYKIGKNKYDISYEVSLSSILFGWEDRKAGGRHMDPWITESVKDCQEGLGNSLIEKGIGNMDGVSLK